MSSILKESEEFAVTAAHGSVDVHHHCRASVAKGGPRAPEGTGELTAICGARRPPVSDPLRLPCCPECRARLWPPCAADAVN
jgi:hypothetical protein